MEFGTIPAIYPSPPSSKPWAIAQAFCSNSLDFGPYEIHPKSSPTMPIVVGNPLPSTKEAFHGVWNDSRHLPKSAIFKTLGYSQAFCSNSVDFGPFETHPKSSPTMTIVVGNPLPSTKEAFHGVWNDSRHLLKSAVFKTLGYSPGFLLKLARFRTLRNSPQIFTNNHESCCKSIWKHIGGFLGSLERFSALTQIRHLQNRGL